MTTAPPIWRIGVVAERGAHDMLADALEIHVEALSAFEISPGGQWRIEGLTRTKPDMGVLRRELDMPGAGEITVEQLPDVDWLARNRQSFPPLRVGRYFVYGSHYAGKVPPGAHGIKLDASIAFGSGEHATTRGCLLAIGGRAKRGRGVRRALDLGCGSAILALAIARSWPARILAADNDRGSVRLARENVRTNGVRGLEVRLSEGFARLPKRARYDLVCANILARPLRKLSTPLARAVARGGVLVLSGLLNSQAADIVAAYCAQRLALSARLVIGEWTTLVMSRR
jgi:ribosomal protein L11 methyltransferase